MREKIKIQYPYSQGESQVKYDALIKSKYFVTRDYSGPLTTEIRFWLDLFYLVDIQV